MLLMYFFDASLRVMYTFWWHSQEIVASWPKIFYFSYMDEIRYFGGKPPFPILPST